MNNPTVYFSDWTIVLLLYVCCTLGGCGDTATDEESAPVEGRSEDLVFDGERNVDQIRGTLTRAEDARNNGDLERASRLAEAAFLARPVDGRRHAKDSGLGGTDRRVLAGMCTGTGSEVTGSNGVLR